MDHAACKKCGKVLPDGATFCPACGASQRESSPTSEQNQGARFIGVGIVVFLLGVGMYTSGKQSPAASPPSPAQTNRAVSVRQEKPRAKGSAERPAKKEAASLEERLKIEESRIAAKPKPRDKELTVISSKMCIAAYEKDDLISALEALDTGDENRLARLASDQKGFMLEKGMKVMVVEKSFWKNLDIVEVMVTSGPAKGAIVWTLRNVLG